MRYTLWLIGISAVLISGCSTDFQAWEGRNKVIQGQGGTRKVVDGIDVWTNGDPPRGFRIIGIIDDSRPGGIIPMANLKHDVAKAVRQHGGDAVIVLSSESQLQGYYTISNATTNVYGRSATTFGSSTTFPATRRFSKFMVIKYVD